MTQTTGSTRRAVGRAGPGGVGSPGPGGAGPAGSGAGGNPPIRARRRRAKARGRVASGLAGLFEGSPGRLRWVGIGAVLACAVFALLGSAAFSARVNALTSANADAAQLIRVQQIATEVVHADSILTSGFPSADEQSAAELSDFDTSLSNAAQLVAEASAADPADSARLAQVADALGQYQEYAANARAANADQRQVAYGYLRQAAAALRGQDAANPDLIVGTGMLPQLNALIATNQQRVDDAYTDSTWATVEMVVAIVVSLGGLVAVQVWLARRTRRYLNVPLVAATAAVLVVALVGAVLSLAAASRADRVRDNSYAALKSLADARIALNAAKSDAAISFLYLRTGGNSTTYGTDFNAQLTKIQVGVNAIADDTLRTGATKSYIAWKSVASGLFTTADSQWGQQATQLATAGSTVNANFDAVDNALQQDIVSRATAVGSGLGDGNVPLEALVWVALVIGVLAGVASWAGIAQRLGDYR